MKERRRWRNCVCGMRVLSTDEQIRSGKMTCPVCGAVMGEDESADMDPSAADTQLINIGDMARMAQEGVDVGVSGEWDTASSRDPLPERGDKGDR